MPAHKLFNSETAKAAAAKSAVARRANIAQLKVLKAALASAQGDGTAELWAKQRLARTRGQLKLADRMLSKCDCPRDFERIANSIARLSEIERKLAGRPDPGARRPGRERTRPEAPIAEPVEILPAISPADSAVGTEDNSPAASAASA